MAFTIVLWLENNYSFSIITNNLGNSWLVPALEAIPLPDHPDLLARPKTWLSFRISGVQRFSYG
jgi:hypothetical protein